VDAVLENPGAAPVPAGEKALFAFIERVNGGSHRLRRQDVEGVLAAGWSEEAVYDAITVCALFNFYNRWCDAAGVHPMTPADHAAGGKRMAERGYLPPP
jgi:alkylhydroperoxidase family enzyme